jgi:hypothetical protein
LKCARLPLLETVRQTIDLFDVKLTNKIHRRIAGMFVPPVSIGAAHRSAQEERRSLYC